MKHFSREKVILPQIAAAQGNILTRTVKKRRREASSCDGEKTVRLNLLAKCLPFCAWYKSRTNDPL
jgi:hypothetical protein